MTDVTTQRALSVSTAPTVGPYIRVPVSQLGPLTELLSRHQVPYEVDELAISMDGGPEMTVVNFSRRVDAAAVQRILDGVP